VREAAAWSCVAQDNRTPVDLLIGQRLKSRRHSQSLLRFVLPSFEEQWGPRARLSRLRSLIEFLRSIDDDKCMVAIRPAAGLSESLTILGDWFVAESVLGETGRGYRQTIFGRHAPTILSRVREFDEQLEELIANRGWRAEESRRAAIDEMETIVGGLLP
jgi:hypothetical protein